MAHIAETMPQFLMYAQEGDEIVFGMDGDPENPYADSEAPMGIITEVEHNVDGPPTLTVLLQSGPRAGTHMVLDPHSIDPMKLWSFSERSFPSVLERAMNMNSAKSSDDRVDVYRGSSGAHEEMRKLRQDVEKMKREYQEGAAEIRNFNNTVVATLNGFAEDMCQLGAGSSSFCNTFHTEYMSMVGGEKGALEYTTGDDLY